MIRWQLAYRGRWGRQIAEVEASTKQKAEELGQEWCTKNGVKFISVSDAVVAREPVVEPSEHLLGGLTPKAKSA